MAINRVNGQHIAGEEGVVCFTGSFAVLEPIRFVMILPFSFKLANNFARLCRCGHAGILRQRRVAGKPVDWPTRDDVGWDGFHSSYVGRDWCVVRDLVPFDPEAADCLDRCFMFLRAVKALRRPIPSRLFGLRSLGAADTRRDSLDTNKRSRRLLM